MRQDLGKLMFEACLSLPRDPREAALIADNLESLARALREWPAEAWCKMAAPETPAANGGPSGLFERLVRRTAPAALDVRHRTRALESAEAAANVLRVLWPDITGHRVAPRRDGELVLAAT
ncbi:MAG TPA: hypothetical protein VGE94_20055 [Chloroflexota bacterium]